MRNKDGIKMDPMGAAEARAEIQSYGTAKGTYNSDASFEEVDKCARESAEDLARYVSVNAQFIVSLVDTYKQAFSEARKAS